MHMVSSIYDEIKIDRSKPFNAYDHPDKMSKQKVMEYDENGEAIFPERGWVVGYESKRSLEVESIKLIDIKPEERNIEQLPFSMYSDGSGLSEMILSIERGEYIQYDAKIFEAVWAHRHLLDGVPGKKIELIYFSGTIFRAPGHEEPSKRIAMARSGFGGWNWLPVSIYDLGSLCP